MNLFRLKDRHKNAKSVKTMSCPVCKGARVMLLTPTEAHLWQTRVTNQKNLRIQSVTQTCWACNGLGQIPIENEGYQLSRFEN